MPDPIMQTMTRSLSQDMRVMTTVSNNVANLHTPGFRRTSTAPAFDAVADVRTAIDQADGALAQTGRSLDLALRGPGFFVVEHAGEARLVRGGAFTLDAARQLRTPQGDPVLGDAGPITLPEGSVTIDAHGGLLAGDGRQFAQLRMVEIVDPTRLRSDGEGRFQYDGETKPWTGVVLQGALEQANVDAATEMVQLMQTTRHVESVQRVINMYDKVLETGINKLGEN